MSSNNSGGSSSALAIALHNLADGFLLTLITLYIIVHDRAYVRINVDGYEAFDGRVLPENVYTYSGEDSIELVTGNGAALEAYFNQEYLGDLGKVGEVVNMTFSLQGLSISIPKPTPTPTVEPAPDDMDDL